MKPDNILMSDHLGNILGSTWEADALFEEKNAISTSTNLCLSCEDHNSKYPYTYLHERPTPGHAAVHIPDHLLSEAERKANQGLIHHMYRLKQYIERVRPNAKDKQYRVAIVVPNRTHGLDQVVLGFVQGFAKQNLNMLPFIYNAEGSSTFLYHHIVPDLYKHDYDLICTVGNECTSLVARFLSHQPFQIPQIFIGVSNPKKLGLDQYAQDYVSGIRANNNLNLYVASILAIKPELKNVGIVFNPYECGGATAQIQKQVEELFGKYGVNSTSVAINQYKDIRSVAQALAPNIDALVTVADNMVSRAVDELIEVCNNTNKLLCVPLLSAAQRGAAFSFGCQEYQVGIAAAQKAILVLRDRIAVSNISISDVTEKHYFLINGRTRFTQGLHLTLNQLTTLEHGRMLDERML